MLAFLNTNKQPTFGCAEYQGRLLSRSGRYSLAHRWSGRAGRDERTPLTLPPGVDLQPIPSDKTLNKMLADGELDAVFSARELSCYVKGAPNVGLMFPNSGKSKATIIAGQKFSR